VILSGEHGDYLLIDPAVSLAGCLAKQNILNYKHKRPVRASLMVSVFDDEQQAKSNDVPYDDEMPF